MKLHKIMLFIFYDKNNLLIKMEINESKICIINQILFLAIF